MTRRPCSPKRTPVHTGGTLCVMALAVVFAVALGIGAAPQWCAAQGSTPARRPLIGFVRTADGTPLRDVAVDISGIRVLTDGRGGFRASTGAVDTATISIRHVGYESLDVILTTRSGQWDTVLVHLDPTPRTLERVLVEEAFTTRAGGLRGFEERRQRGLGTFVTRDEIVDRGSSKLSDILRSKRGVAVVRGRVRFAGYLGSRGATCQPNIWLDGARAPGMEVDEIMAQSIEAVELYPNFSSVPIEFQQVGAQTTPCGSIVIWTRIPNAKNR